MEEQHTHPSGGTGDAPPGQVDSMTGGFGGVGQDMRSWTSAQPDQPSSENQTGLLTLYHSITFITPIYLALVLVLS